MWSVESPILPGLLILGFSQDCWPLMSGVAGGLCQIKVSIRSLKHARMRVLGQRQLRLRAERNLLLAPPRPAPPRPAPSHVRLNQQVSRSSSEILSFEFRALNIPPGMAASGGRACC